ncbi:MAG: universal stress protein [Nocardioides sp.]|uniref:universal stress protein n=1 Tax=Nocardioides sp. TaxID=35761 RepID=UPI0039E5B5D6
MSTVVLLTHPASAQAALAWAVQFATEHRHHLHVVVTGADTPGAPSYVSPRVLAELDQALVASGLAFTAHVESRDPAAKAVALTEEHQADVLVVGIRRRSVTAKFLLGSAAQRVSRDADCPVVLVKGEHLSGP